jgi:hypothetical protein
MPNAFALAGPDSKYKLPGATPAGFWAGFWHGLIAPWIFLVSLFVPGIRIYETNNKGRRYDFGFLLAIGAWASHHETRHMIEGKDRI